RAAQLVADHGDHLVLGALGGLTLADLTEGQDGAGETAVAAQWRGFVFDGERGAVVGPGRLTPVPEDPDAAEVPTGRRAVGDVGAKEGNVGADRPSHEVDLGIAAKQPARARVRELDSSVGVQA